MEIKGARVNNLKNIDCSIPSGGITVITGVSGSGKSSLAFDTIYAEGQRRYVESLSAYARQFLERMEKPDVDSITGIQPAIAVEQKNYIRSSRATVGSLSEIDDYLKLLFARAGTTFCPKCNIPAVRHTPQSLVDRIIEKFSGNRGTLVIPVPVPHKIDVLNLFAERLKQDGFFRVMIDGEVKDIDSITSGQFAKYDEIDMVVDRFLISQENTGRISDAVETGLRLNTERGAVVIEGYGIFHYAFSFSCEKCRKFFTSPEPHMFSYNSPVGACPNCHGFGRVIGIDLDKVIPDRDKPLNKGAIAPWNSPAYEDMYITLRHELVKAGISFTSSFNKLSRKGREILIEGAGDFCGINGFFKYLEEKKYKLHIRVLLSRYRSFELCAVCNGTRLKDDALWVKVLGKNIFELQTMSIDELSVFFSYPAFRDSGFEPVKLILEELRNRTGYLLNVGLNYVTLNRQARTLSGGEMQRINLSKALGSLLTGTLYVLDEPTVGLHPRDTSRLIGVLKELSRRGNTLVVVEHDMQVIKNADKIIDLGPGAGELGGEVVFEGTFDELLTNKNSLTAKHISAQRGISAGKKHSVSNVITISKAKKNNIKGVDFKIPLQSFVCLTGVSGAGKSTLLEEILYPAIKSMKGGKISSTKCFDSIDGIKNIDSVIMVDQSPIGRQARSNPVTYVKAYSEIRKLMAGTRSAEIAGVTERDFSFNTGDGRCPKCNGLGKERVEMQFLADLELICDECDGKRFRKKVLDVTHRNKNISDILNMTVEQSLAFFSDSPQVKKNLSVLKDMGLGYLKLGQSTSTLSGGEAQRLKLAGLLVEKKKEASYLFLFDEPTTGLHMADVYNLVEVFKKLVAEGNSIVAIEHNLEFIINADYIIDMGPEGGDSGGRIVCEGTVMDVAKCKESYTGKFLRERINLDFAI
ncbi:MAG: excinuclease ABC subunit UvrA [Candidatus Schekmanbacteria bacterium]|nr:excinuclease ABC subunit UvrA [Candidatus Schekmanbacteria bacterium]